MLSFNECGGFYTGNAFLAWFRKKLQAKGIDPDLTWSQFAAKTGSDVSVVTSDVTDQEMVILNERTAPQVPVAHAVRMSMSIPFVWREMIWDGAWGTYLGRDKTGHIFVDGGVLSNFPLELVAESNSEIIKIMGNTDPNGAGTLGLMLDQNIPVPGAANSQTPRPRLRTADRVTRLIDTMTGSSDAEIMRKYPKLICHLPVGGYGTTEFRMSQDRMNRIDRRGTNRDDDLSISTGLRLVSHTLKIPEKKHAAGTILIATNPHLRARFRVASVAICTSAIVFCGKD